MGDLSKRLQYMVKDDDDWSKLEDQKMRKRVQNRLAQRKRRFAKQKLEARGRQFPPAKFEPDLPALTIVQNAHVTTECIESATIAYGLSEHRFIRLAQYSTMRAVFLNANILGLNVEHFEDDETLSPWNTTHLGVADELVSAGFPPSLCPSSLQKKVLHHPFIDILASGPLRDNILLAKLSDEEEEQLCMDLVCDGFSIWGSQPWSPIGWEVSQVFADRWSRLLDEQTIMFSNFWRFERGELGLQVNSRPAFSVK